MATIKLAKSEVTSRQQRPVMRVLERLPKVRYCKDTLAQTERPQVSVVQVENPFVILPTLVTVLPSALKVLLGGLAGV